MVVSRILAVAITASCCASGYKIPSKVYSAPGLLVERIDPNTLSACIVETRKMASVPMVIVNLVHRFPGMKVQLFYSSTNADWVQEQPTLKRLKSDGILVLTQTPAPYYSGLNMPTNVYSQMLASPQFWDLTLTPKLLIFQADVWFCNGATAKKLEPLLKYDYVGAQWGFTVSQCPGGVGNGGLSIRDKAAMIRVSRQFEIGGLPEDVFFCTHLQANVAPRHVAETFSREAVPSKSQSLGVHAGNIYLDGQTRAHLDDRCPGYSYMLQSHRHQTVDSADFKISEEMVQHWQSNFVPKMSFVMMNGDDQAAESEFAVSATQWD